MDFTVENKASLTSPYIICQSYHKEQKSPLSCCSCDQITVEKRKACLGFQFTCGSELSHIYFSTVTPKHLVLPFVWR